MLAVVPVLAGMGETRRAVLLVAQQQPQQGEHAGRNELLCEV